MHLSKFTLLPTSSTHRTEIRSLCLGHSSWCLLTFSLLLDRFYLYQQLGLRPYFISINIYWQGAVPDYIGETEFWNERISSLVCETCEYFHSISIKRSSQTRGMNNYVEYVYFYTYSYSLHYRQVWTQFTCLYNIHCDVKCVTYYCFIIHVHKNNQTRTRREVACALNQVKGKWQIFSYQKRTHTSTNERYKIQIHANKRG